MVNYYLTPNCQTCKDRQETCHKCQMVETDRENRRLARQGYTFHKVRNIRVAKRAGLSLDRAKELGL